MVRRFDPLVLLAVVLMLLDAIQVSAGVIIDDGFRTFDTDTWTVAAGVSGLPDYCLQTLVDGSDCLWMKSHMDPYDLRGIQLDRAFHLTSARAEVVFMPVSGGIDGALQFRLLSPSTGKQVGIMLFGGSYGTERYVYSIGDFGGGGSDVNQWGYDQWYRFVIDATGPRVQASAYRGNGSLIWAYTFGCDLAGIGPDISVSLTQYMGIPTQPWDNIVAIDSVTLSGEGMPVVGTTNKSAGSAVSQAAKDRFRFCVWGKARAVDGGVELDDGSGNPVTVAVPVCPGFLPGDVLRATGLLDTYPDKTTLHCVSGDMVNLSR